jgi:hypothetical protein
MAQKRFGVSVDVPNLMLSWQEAALLAIGLGAAAVLLAVAKPRDRPGQARASRGPVGGGRARSRAKQGS